MSERFTIGALARRSGVPVKTLRYYSDEGLLPASRSGGGYRVYSEEDALRLDLIRTLREAGLSIAEIRSILARELGLGDALRLRLCAVEAHIASLQHVAAALRGVLRSAPDDNDLRRLCTVTRLTHEERRAVIERFQARVAEGVPSGETWKRDIILASAPRLPDEPSPAQLDAWIELTEMVQDEGFVAAMRASAGEAWSPDFDLASHQQASEATTAAARELLERGVPPGADEARPVVERLVAAFASAMGRQGDESFRAAMHAKFAGQDPRSARYWALVAVLAGGDAPQWPHAEWRWLAAAVLHHLAPV